MTFIGSLGGVKLFLPRPHTLVQRNIKRGNVRLMVNALMAGLRGMSSMPARSASSPIPSSAVC